MSKKLKDQAVAKYLAYCHTTEQSTSDFNVLERQVRTENSLYGDAIKETYAMKLLSRKKLQEVLDMLDEKHKEFHRVAQQSIEDFDALYQKTDAERRNLGPNYKKGEFDYNSNEFRRYCSAFASRYGDWFWDERLRHDPLDDMCYGYATIRELQNYENGSWYPNMEDWLDIPYGARLFRIHLCWWDLTMAILVHQGKYKTKPTKELREMINTK